MKNLVIIALCMALASASLLDTRKAAEITFSNFQAVASLLGLKDEVDYTFDYMLTTSATTGIDFAPFLFGTNGAESGEGEPVKLHVTTSLTKVALASGTLASPADGWGLNCTDTNHCVPGGTAFSAGQCDTTLVGFNVYDKLNQATAYWTKDAQGATTNECRPATTFIRWTNSTLDKPEDYQTNLPVTLFQTAPSTGVKSGLLGIAPNSDFIKYIQSKTDALSDQTFVEFGLSMTPNSGAAKLVDTTDVDAWKQNQFVIKGKRNGGDIPFMSTNASPLDTDGKPTSWTIGKANFTLAENETSTYTPKENQLVCVSSEFPWMMGFANAADSTALLAYFNKVCPNSDGTNCAEENATKDAIKSVTLGLSNQDLTGTLTDDLKTYKLTIDTNDILWFNKPDSGNPTMTPIIGQPIASANMVNYGCPTTANIIVGKPFLSKYEAVMHVGSTTYELGFIANEGTSSIFLIILIILGCIILAICIAIILLKVCKRKSSDEQEYTRQD